MAHNWFRFMEDLIKDGILSFSSMFIKLLTELPPVHRSEDRTRLMYSTIPGTNQQLFKRSLLLLRLPLLASALDHLANLAIVRSKPPLHPL
jgi:hypothetical protein